MTKSGVPAASYRAIDYVLVAIGNAARAAAIRNLALEVCPEVVLVRDGQDAVQHIDRHGPPRLLITELSLPRVDGFALLRHLRRTVPSTRAGALVVSSHEALRTAAMKLADSLGISQILPLDADRLPLRRAIADAIRGGEDGVGSRASGSGRPGSPSEATTVDELINRALLDITRQFKVPAAAAYLRILDQRKFAVYGSVADPSPSLDWSPVLELLPAAASAEDPLLVPDLDQHPLFGRPGGSVAVRGFAGVPLMHAGGARWGAIAVIDARPLAMAPDDVDGLCAFAGDLADKIETVIGAPREASAALPSEIEQQIGALEQLAATDPLTGLANRRGCEKSIAGEISRAERERKPLSVIMLDIDRFKQVNDTMGHQAGDHVLRELSTMLRQSVRAYDIVARWGGEEFLLVLPGADLEAARQLAERIRVGVQKLPAIAPGTITISAGAAQFDANYDFEATLRAADRRMYEAKAAGRNCVV